MKARYFLGLLILFLTGCASKYATIDSNQEEACQSEVSARSKDISAVADKRKVMRVWIKGYVSEDGYLIGPHHVYFYVEKPGFKAGTQNPAHARVTQKNGKAPICILRSKMDITPENEKETKEYWKEINQK